MVKKIILSILVFLVLIFFIDTLLKLRDEKPIYVGKVFAVNLMLGNKVSLVSLAKTKELKERIRNTEFKQIEPEWLKGEIGSIAWKYNLQLYEGRRLSEFGDLILTYGFVDILTSDKVFTYTIQLAPFGTATFWDMSVGKLFMSEHKQAPVKWAVVDFYTDSDITEYVKDWNKEMERSLEDDYFNDKAKVMMEQMDEFIEDSDKIMETRKKLEKDYMKIQDADAKQYLQKIKKQ